MDTDRYIKETITKYNLNGHYRKYLKEEFPKVKSLEQIYLEDEDGSSVDKYAFLKQEIAFLAMLNWFFSHKEVPKGFFKRDKLSILDVGCGNMFYAVPLKLFFEHAGGKERALKLMGIDSGDSYYLNQAGKRLKQRGVDIELKATPLEKLSADTYEVITCFNCNIDSNPDFFFKHAYNRLAEDGVFLLSFKFGRYELERYQNKIKNAGLKIQFEIDNPFGHEVTIIGEDHSYLCVATISPFGRCLR